MFSELTFKIIVYGALSWTGLAFLILIGLFVKDWLKKNIW
jgi:hypothetical protein